MKIAAASMSLPKPGERENGDAVLIRTDSERTLLAVIDGVGHGTAAAEASNRAHEWLSGADLEADIGRTMEGLHDALRGTRGAAATLCLIENRTLHLCGVGNVELRSWGADVPLLLSPGILGSRVGRFKVFDCRPGVATRLFLFSDGVRMTGVLLGALQALRPQDACQRVIEDHRRMNDDASILIADIDL